MSEATWEGFSGSCHGMVASRENRVAEEFSQAIYVDESQFLRKFSLPETTAYTLQTKIDAPLM